MEIRHVNPRFHNKIPLFLQGMASAPAWVPAHTVASLPSNVHLAAVDGGGETVAVAGDSDIALWRVGGSPDLQRRTSAWQHCYTAPASHCIATMVSLPRSETLVVALRAKPRGPVEGGGGLVAIALPSGTVRQTVAITDDVVAMAALDDAGIGGDGGHIVVLHASGRLELVDMVSLESVVSLDLPNHAASRDVGSLSPSLSIAAPVVGRSGTSRLITMTAAWGGEGSRAGGRAAALVEVTYLDGAPPSLTDLCAEIGLHRSCDRDLVDFFVVPRGDAPSLKLCVNATTIELARCVFFFFFFFFFFFLFFLVSLMHCVYPHLPKNTCKWEPGGHPSPITHHPKSMCPDLALMTAAMCLGCTFCPKGARRQGKHRVEARPIAPPRPWWPRF